MIDVPCLYPITDRRLAGDRSHAAIVSLLCRGGATLIQVREKHMQDADLIEAARAAVVEARASGARIIVNDRADVAALAGAAGVHLGDEDLPPADARGILGPAAIIGRSTHTVQEAIAAAQEPVDYIALGPIFDTSHAGIRRPALGLAALAEAARGISLPLVAIGGFDVARARQALDAGAAGVAVLGDLMTAPDIPERTAAYLALRG
ncbi:MAG TPA: thiamine phosphate synthase [Candidatus Polarisedimenticolia bacterium]|nr:thiamine phosphate synthase [Candidatus Polarisedimenticolia bacterium]